MTYGELKAEDLRQQCRYAVDHAMRVFKEGGSAILHFQPANDARRPERVAIMSESRFRGEQNTQAQQHRQPTS